MLRGRVPLVSRGVIGDELVAAEYLRLWGPENWGTMIRSSDPVVVGAIGMDYPELIPYLAPVTTPPVAEARYLRSLVGKELRVVYAGPWSVDSVNGLDASLTFKELEQMFRIRGVDVMSQPTVFSRVPMERRRHHEHGGRIPLACGSLPGGPGVPRLHRIRGLDGLRGAGPRGGAVSGSTSASSTCSRARAGSIIRSPGPRDMLLWRRTLVQNAEPARSHAAGDRSGGADQRGRDFPDAPGSQAGSGSGGGAGGAGADRAGPQGRSRGTAGPVVSRPARRLRAAWCGAGRRSGSVRPTWKSRRTKRRRRRPPMR